MTMDDGRASRANIPVAIFRRGEEPPDNWVESLSAEQRFEMVAQLSARLFEFAGFRARKVARHEIPVRVTRLR